MIYLDNSATTFFKPQSVKNAVIGALNSPANPSRSSHSAALAAAVTLHSARRALASYLGAKSEDGVIFTKNCTEALNIAVASLANCHVITTVREHNSVLRPLKRACREKNVRVSVVSFPSPEEIERHIRRDTKAVIINHVSNLTGEIAPIRDIGKICDRYGLVFIVDGAQSAGYEKIDMLGSNIDMLAVAPHKGLHAAMGAGALVVNPDVKVAPLVLGGTGSATFDLDQEPVLPDGVESGTLPLPAIASIPPAIEWCEQNAENNRETIKNLSEILLDSLARDEKIDLYTPKDSARGVIAFNLSGAQSSAVGDFLNEKYGICVRCGYHCAPLMHQHLGTVKSGAIRVSIGCDNTEDDIKTLIKAIKDAEELFVR